MQWCRVVRKVATINIGSALDQEPHGGMVPAQDGQVQRRGLLNPASPCVNELRVRIEMLTKLGEISGLRRPDDGGYHLGLTVGAGQILLAISRQQLNGRMALVLGDLIDGAAIRVRGCGIETRGECPAHSVNVASAGCGKHAVAVLAADREAIDMALQRTPAFEAVVVGDGKLGSMQGRSRVTCAQLGEPLLGGLFEPIKVGLGREGLRHDIPSFFAPGDRSSRARKKDVSAQCWRWVRPFTRSVGRLLDHKQPYPTRALGVNGRARILARRNRMKGLEQPTRKRLERTPYEHLSGPQ